MEPPCDTKPIGKSFKCQVSSVKKGKAVVWASNFTLYTSNSAEGRLYEQTQFARYAGRTKEFPVRCRRWRFCTKNPEYRFGHMWYSGVLVFWYSGLAPRKTRFGGRGPGVYLARGGLEFWPQNSGGCVPEGRVPGLQTSHFTLGRRPLVANKPNFGEV